MKKEIYACNILKCFIFSAYFPVHTQYKPISYWHIIFIIAHVLLLENMFVTFSFLLLMFTLHQSNVFVLLSVTTQNVLRIFPSRIKKIESYVYTGKYYYGFYSLWFNAA